MIAPRDNPLAAASFSTADYAGPLMGTDLGYDAVKDSNHRRKSPSRNAQEDLILKKQGRDKLAGAGYDIQKNFTAAAWAIRKHLDYVSAFRFQAKSGNEDFDDELEDFMRTWSGRRRCDARGKHPLRRMVRLAEAQRTIGGDVGSVKLVGQTAGDWYRGKISLVEADRIRTPEKKDRAETWWNGARVNGFGEELEYAVHNRKGTGFELAARVPARNMLMLGYYDRIDQVRGISPLASALNQFRDTYQGFDYALAKLKVAQLFGLVLTTTAAEGLGNHHYAGEETEIDSDGDGDFDADDTAPKYEVDFGAGPVKLEIEPGEKAEFLEARTPASETVAFLRLILMVAIKSLDIPFSFFDESFTNFYGSRGGVMQYLKSCKNKREDLQEWLNELTRWRVGLAILDGELILPAGMTFNDIRWQWIPEGVPWWDPAKEARGAALSVAAGFDNIPDVCAGIGTNVYDNIDRNAEVIQYAKEKGVPIILPGAAAFNPEPVVQVSETEGGGDA